MFLPLVSDFKSQGVYCAFTVPLCLIQSDCHFFVPANHGVYNGETDASLFTVYHRRISREIRNKTTARKKTHRKNIAQNPRQGHHGRIFTASKAAGSSNLHPYRRSRARPGRSKLCHMSGADGRTLRASHPPPLQPHLWEAVHHTVAARA